MQPAILACVNVLTEEPWEKHFVMSISMLCSISCIAYLSHPHDGPGALQSRSGALLARKLHLSLRLVPRPTGSKT